MTRALVLIAALVAGGCSSGVHDLDGDGRVVIACLGDSNTETRWPPPQTPKWCEFAAAERPEWTFTNHAVGGATVTRPPDERSWSGPQLDAALAASRLDAVVLAFGTNDVRADRSTAEIVAAYRAAAARASAGGTRVFVALTPSIYPPEPEHTDAIAALNRTLRQAFPADSIIDFATGMAREDFEADGLHPNASGQHKRAQAALRTLAHGSCD